MSQPRPPNYLAYLLRLWRDGEHAPWRASLESIAPPERHNFATLGKLFEFLMNQLEREMMPEEKPKGGRGTEESEG